MLKSLFNKVAGLQACNFIKKRFLSRSFPVNIAKFLRTARTPQVTAFDNIDTGKRHICFTL